MRALARDPPVRGGRRRCYRQAELHRLRGEFAEAEEAYRQASRAGATRSRAWRCCGWRRARSTPPRRRSAASSTRPRTSPRARGCCRPYVEIMLAAGDIDAAARRRRRAGGDRRDASTRRCCARVAAQAQGAVLLAEGDARAALARCAGAWTAWQELEAPYEAARARVLIGLACRALGDEDTAAMELDAARWVFQRARRRARPGPGRRARASPRRRGRGGLTAREVEVLRLVPPARRTARSPPSWSSARRRSPAT